MEIRIELAREAEAKRATECAAAVKARDTWITNNERGN
jgi:hypothetical protein